MPWAKIDDRFHAHPKVARAGDAAIGLHIRALSYCAAYLTDGLVPRDFARGKKRAASRLVAVGLWEVHADGWVIHDYLEYNLSAEEVKEQREIERAIRSAGGKARASVASRNGGRFVPADQPTEEPAGHQQGDQQPAGVAAVPHPPAPTRTQSLPFPVLEVLKTSEGDAPAGVAGLVDLYRSFPGVQATDQDGGLIAGMVAKHGAGHVEAVLRDVDTSIGAATNPLQYLAGACKRPRKRAGLTIEDRAKGIADRIRRYESQKPKGAHS